MDAETLKAKVAEYPIATGALVVAIAAGALLYARSDVESQLIADREEKSKTLQAMRLNEANSKSLAEDLRRAERLHGKVTAMAINFGSSIDVQTFLADFVQSASVKIPDLPIQQTKPVVIPAAKPISTCFYRAETEAGYRDLLRFASALQADSKRAMVVSRVNVGAEKTADIAEAKTATGGLPCEVSFRLWGRTEEIPAPGRTPDKQVVPSAERLRRLDAAEAALSAKPKDFSQIGDPFGLPAAAPVSGGTRPVAVGTDHEAALSALEFSVITFLGEPAVKIKGIGTKRVNNEFELKSGTQLLKFKIASIEADSFYVATPAGVRIKVSQKK